MLGVVLINMWLVEFIFSAVVAGLECVKVRQSSHSLVSHQLSVVLQLGHCSSLSMQLQQALPIGIVSRTDDRCHGLSQIIYFSFIACLLVSDGCV